MSKNFIKFIGNCPRNVSKDATYSVRSDSGEYVIGLLFRADDGEEWYPTSNDHPQLVEMVNEIKLHFTGSRGGSFYINEFKQVLVPTGGDRDYYYAGEYHEPLEFKFEGKIISGNPVADTGQALDPGEPWTGPHHGVPYTLAANNRDIYFEYELRPSVKKKVQLSKIIGVNEARKVAQEFVQYKGYNGGRFYVNEFGNVFAPLNTDYGVEYIYLGKIDYAKWFEKPEIDASETAFSKE